MAIAPSASALSSTASIDLTSPDGSTERIALAGTSTLSITSGVTNPDGMADQFDIELGPLVLTGTSFVFGALTLTVAGAPSSVGLVRELSNGTPGVVEYPADSRIDAYFVLDIPSFAVLHNQSPVILVGVISSFPPAAGETYDSVAPIPLLDASDQPSEFFLSAVVYTPVPEPSLLPLLAGGFLALRRAARPRRGSGAASSGSRRAR